MRCEKPTRPAGELSDGDLAAVRAGKAVAAGVRSGPLGGLAAAARRSSIRAVARQVGQGRAGGRGGRVQ